MLEEFEVTKYRGLENLKLSSLRRVNLVTGPNGVGKTSLSEALWLYHARYNPVIIWSIHIQRRPFFGGLSPLANLGQRPIKLRGLEDGQQYGVEFDFEEVLSALPVGVEGSEESSSSEAHGLISSYARDPLEIEQEPHTVAGRLRMTYDPDPTVRTEFHAVVIGPAGQPGIRGTQAPKRAPAIILTRGVPFPIQSDTIQRFSNVVAQGDKKALLEILGVLQPTIQDLEILSHQNTPSLWADVGAKELLPVEALGGGVVRLLALFVNLFSAKGGFFVVDEIENGIHHSALPVLWQQIFRLSQLLDVQLVATTHSLECARAAASASEIVEAPHDFALHQLHSRDDIRQIETYTDEKLMAALELGFEVR